MSAGLSAMSIGRLASLACHLECAAPKVGNVHRGADFADVTFYDFLASGEIVGDVIDRNQRKRVGEKILECVRWTQADIGSNTNLGIVLLLVPLAEGVAEPAARRIVTPGQVAEVLARLDSRDSACIYEAIRLAKPGGLQRVEKFDVQGTPPISLLDAMAVAASHDDIARQYVTNFQDVFEIATALEKMVSSGMGLIEAIVREQVNRLARSGDSLIARKGGSDLSRRAQGLAQRVVDVAESREDYERALSELDFWLRADGNRRNPGTTADLIAGGIFVGLVNNLFPLKF